MEDNVLWETSVLYNKYAKKLRQQNNGGLRGTTELSFGTSSCSGLLERVEEVRSLQQQMNSSGVSLQQSVSTSDMYDTLQPRNVREKQSRECNAVVSDEMRKVFHRHKAAMRTRTN